MSSLIRFHYDPFIEFERLFDDALVRVQRTSINPTRHLDSFRPRIDMKESKDSNEVTATFELPGLKPEDVAIDLQQNRLTVSGESTASNAHEGAGYAVRERRYGKFSRTLPLPLGTKAEDVKAKMESGLLTVIFPKETPEQESHRIAVQ